MSSTSNNISDSSSSEEELVSELLKLTQAYQQHLERVMLRLFNELPPDFKQLFLEQDGITFKENFKQDSAILEKLVSHLVTGFTQEQNPDRLKNSQKKYPEMHSACKKYACIKLLADKVSSSDKSPKQKITDFKSTFNQYKKNFEKHGDKPFFVFIKSVTRLLSLHSIRKHWSPCFWRSEGSHFSHDAEAKLHPKSGPSPKSR